MSLDAFLDRLYADVPPMACKGLCADTCRDAIPVYGAEYERLVGRLGPVPPPREPNVCPFLESGRCSIYDLRPLVCRTHGAIDPALSAEQDVPIWVCPHGCRPDAWLEPARMLTLLEQLDPLSVRSFDARADAAIQRLRAEGHQVYGFTPTPEGLAVLVKEEP